MTGIMTLDGKSAARGKDLFDAKFDVLLYVLTRRYFESLFDSPRGFGYSFAIVSTGIHNQHLRTVRVIGRLDYLSIVVRAVGVGGGDA